MSKNKEENVVDISAGKKEQEKKAPEPKSALQRIEGLEMMVRAISAELDSINSNLQKAENVSTKCLNFMASLGRVIKSGEPLTESAINQAAIDNKCEALKGVIDKLLEQNLVEAAETVCDESIVVVREYDADGNITSHRSQFPLRDFVKEVGKKFLGKKVGDKVQVVDNPVVNFEITEIFDFVKPPQKEELPKAE